MMSIRFFERGHVLQTKCQRSQSGLPLGDEVLESIDPIVFDAGRFVENLSSRHATATRKP
jgi:hypothetical protein